MCFCPIKQEWHYTEKIVMQNIAGFIGKEMSLSQWRLITQDMIN